MTHPVPTHCTQAHQYGPRYLLGSLDSGGYALWDYANDWPAITFPPGPDGWNAAWTQFWTWNAPQPPQHPAQHPAQVRDRGLRRLVTGLLIVAVILGGYWGFHEYRYHNCLITPSIMSWPNGCL